jgi:hypothetical protein
VLGQWGTKTRRVGETEDVPPWMSYNHTAREGQYDIVEARTAHMGCVGRAGFVQRVSNPTAVGLPSARRRMAAHYAQPSLCPQDALTYPDDVGGGKCPFRLCRNGNWWGGWGRKFFVTIAVIVLEKSENQHVHQFKSAQGGSVAHP